MTTTDSVDSGLVPTIWGFMQVQSSSDGVLPPSLVRVDTVFPAILTAAELAYLQDHVRWHVSVPRRRARVAVTVFTVGLGLTVGLITVPWWALLLAVPALGLSSSIVASWVVDAWVGRRLRKHEREALRGAVDLRVEHLVAEPLLGKGTQEEPLITAMRLLAHSMRDIEKRADVLSPLDRALARQLLWTALDPSTCQRVSRIVVAAAYLARIGKCEPTSPGIEASSLDQ